MQEKDPIFNISETLTPDQLTQEYNSLYGKVGPRLASMQAWPSDWIPASSGLGWLDWYQGYMNGRRTEDDDRQIKRWKSFKARHGSQFKSNPTPRRAFALRNWAIDPLKMIEDEDQRRQLAEAMETYKQKAWDNYNNTQER